MNKVQLPPADGSGGRGKGNQHDPVSEYFGGSVPIPENAHQKAKAAADKAKTISRDKQDEARTARVREKRARAHEKRSWWDNKFTGLRDTFSSRWNRSHKLTEKSVINGFQKNLHDFKVEVGIRTKDQSEKGRALFTFRKAQGLLEDPQCLGAGLTLAIILLVFVLETVLQYKFFFNSGNFKDSQAALGFVALLSGANIGFSFVISWFWRQIRYRRPMLPEDHVDKRVYSKMLIGSVGMLFLVLWITAVFRASNTSLENMMAAVSQNWSLLVPIGNASAVLSFGAGIASALLLFLKFQSGFSDKCPGFSKMFNACENNKLVVMKSYKSMLKKNDKGFKKAKKSLLDAPGIEEEYHRVHEEAGEMLTGFMDILPELNDEMRNQ